MTHTIKRNDTSPDIQGTCLDAAGNAVDITGATVRFHMFDKNGTEVVDAAATIVTAASGIVKYSWIAADTATAGIFMSEFEVTYSDASIETFPNEGYTPVSIGADLA